MAPRTDVVTATETHDGDEDRVPARSFPRRARLVLGVAALLVVSTMGGATAAALITGRQIKDGTVTGRDVRDHSLRPKDAKAGLVRPGPSGPVGAVGPAGPSGVTGAPGRDGLGGLVTVVSPTAFTVPGDQIAGTTLTCPTGLSALGGGAAGANATAVRVMALARSVPATSSGLINGWSVAVRNFSGSAIGVFLWVQCAPI